MHLFRSPMAMIECWSQLSPSMVRSVMCYCRRKALRTWIKKMHLYDLKRNKAWRVVTVRKGDNYLGRKKLTKFAKYGWNDCREGSLSSGREGGRLL